MPLQHFQYDNFRTPEAVVDMINEVIDYTNDLEARLVALERPVERLSDEE